MPAEFEEYSLYNDKIKVKFFPASHIYMVNGKRKTGVTTYLGIVDKSRPLVYWATDLACDELIARLPNGITEKDIIEACGLHEVRKQEAADIGTKIHDWCEQYIKNKLQPKKHPKPDMPEEREVQIGVAAFIDWEKEHKVKFVSSERVVYSRKNDFIGKMDIECLIDGDLFLVDLKSSSGLYNTVLMQTAAYVRADEEESGRKYAGRWAIRLAKETEKEYLAKMQKKQAKDVKKGKEPRPIPPYQVFEAKYLDPQKGLIERDYEAFKSAKHLHEWNRETDFFLNK